MESTLIGRSIVWLTETSPIVGGFATRKNATDRNTTVWIQKQLPAFTISNTNFEASQKDVEFGPARVITHSSSVLNRISTEQNENKIQVGKEKPDLLGCDRHFWPNFEARKKCNQETTGFIRIFINIDFLKWDEKYFRLFHDYYKRLNSGKDVSLVIGEAYVPWIENL